VDFCICVITSKIKWIKYRVVTEYLELYRNTVSFSVITLIINGLSLVTFISIIVISTPELLFV
jgi:hypothetical protein